MNVVWRPQHDEVCVMFIFLHLFHSSNLKGTLTVFMSDHQILQFVLRGANLVWMLVSCPAIRLCSLFWNGVFLFECMFHVRPSDFAVYHSRGSFWLNACYMSDHQTLQSILRGAISVWMLILCPTIRLLQSILVRVVLFECLFHVRLSILWSLFYEGKFYFECLFYVRPSGFCSLF